VRGFLFDYDGTLVLSEHVHISAWEDVASDIGQQLPSNFAELSVGLTDTDIIKELREHWSGDDSGWYERKQKHFFKRALTEVKLVPGVEAFLNASCKTGPMAIVTSSRRKEIDPILDHLKIDRFFKTRITLDDVQNPKPAPEPYLKAAEAIGCTATQCIAFEDSPTGARAAKAAGARVVGIMTIFNQQVLSMCDDVIEDFNDVRLGKILTELGF
jgi:HAD superfamily hydrolase (TIGR01509 family)